ncbi:MAG TPA: hypothetical protein VHE53_05835 [Patescibacteria group bacterium]|nr:hypothetical protein [Patescibacteria group bacterium]
MSEFRLYDKNDRWIDPNFRAESGWQDEAQMDFPFVDLSPYAVKALKHLSKGLEGLLLKEVTDKATVDFSIRVLDKLTADTQYGKQIISSPRNSSEGVRLISPVLEAAKHEYPDPAWINKYESERLVLTGQGVKFRAVEFGAQDSGEALEKIGTRTGINEYHTLIDQAVRVADWVLSEVVAGNVIYSMDIASGISKPYVGVCFASDYGQILPEHQNAIKRISPCVNYRLPTAA